MLADSTCSPLYIPALGPPAPCSAVAQSFSVTPAHRCAHAPLTRSVLHAVH